MNEICYLLDENVDPLFRTELAKHEQRLLIWKVGDPGAPPTSTSDPEILRWREGNSFLLVTNNRKSMPKHLRDHLSQSRHIPGIFELNPDMSIRETIEELHLIWGASDPNEYRDLLLYLPLT